MGRKHDYIAYTDGGYSMKHNIGAFAYVLLKDGQIVSEKAYPRKNETNNRMELKAIMAVAYFAEEGASILVRSDSQYAIGVLSGDYTPTFNEDLIDMFGEIVKSKKLTIDFEWVRGHNGNKWNEYCDKLCNQAVGINLNTNYGKYKKK